MVQTISVQTISTHTIIPLYTMKTFLIILVLFILIIEVAGQNKKIKFSSVNQFGLLSGSSGESWM